jgi:alpha-mannosidase
MNKQVIILLISILPAVLFAQPTERRAKYDISKERVLYTVGYTHLDSEYEWDYKTTVSEYLKNTMAENYRLFEKYPDYVYNFTGSRRYKLMKEYHPELYAKLKGYIDAGRWYVAGSSVEEGEVNVSSPESVIRQVLYGNNFFRNEFDKESMDYMLPDCFGFVANLPTVLHHAGVMGFSTQKLTISSFKAADPIPFNVGVWNGPDGKGVVACMDATDYDGDVFPRLDLEPYWDERLNEDYKRFGISFDYRYYGCGDMGGGLRDRDLVNLEGSLRNPDSKHKVVLTSSDQMYRDITPEIYKKLPVYTGDLLLIEHSAGSMTSQSCMKRLNRKNEILAQSAEAAACMAGYLTGAVYPEEKLNNAWELVLGSQMHDVLPGTAIPSAFNLAWNDEFIAQNGFAKVTENSLGEVTSALNTEVKGRAIAVFNPVAKDREDICTAEMEFDTIPDYIRVFDAKGKEIPSQVIARTNKKITFIFPAKVPSVGVAVFEARESVMPSKLNTPSLLIQPNILENEYYKVKLNEKGEIAGITDKKQDRELLQKPARLEFLEESPRREPAWNMFWYDRQKPPFAFMDEDVSIKMVENGPVRVAFEVTKKGQNSVIKQIISLAAGEAGKRIEVDNTLNWQSTGVSLKAAFPFTVANKNATYNLGAGTIQRANNVENKFEVPSKKWFDLTDQSGEFGISVLEDCRYGSDKPDDHTVRLTLEYTPSAEKCPTWLYQNSQDWGIQNIKYGLYGHSGDWAESETQWQAEFLNTPLIACEVQKHKGNQSAFSFLSVSNPQVGLMALKKAEESDYLIVRVNELSGKDQSKVSVQFAGKIVDAFEVNGQEKKIGDAGFSGNSLSFDISHYTIRSFAVKISPVNLLPFEQAVVTLDFDQDVMSFDDNRTDGDMVKKYDPARHGEVQNYPAEMIPEELISEGVKFKPGSTADLQKNVVTCSGQTIKLPAGNFNKIYILASAVDESTGTFMVNGNPVDIHVAKWYGFTGQHYDRKFDLDGHTVLDVKEPFLKHDNIAWFASHYHFGYPTHNVPYTYCYIFRYEINLPAGCSEITLPDNNAIKIFALTAARKNSGDILLLQPLTDDFSKNGPFVLRKPAK